MSRDRQLPTISDLIDHRIEVAMASMNCVSLGTVQAFDASSQTATISINYKRIIKESKMASNNIDTVDEVVEYPILVKCPVVVLSGGVSRMTLPIAKGDTCLIFFCDREIDTWYRTGVVTFPQSERIHNLTDAVALVGIRSTQNSITGFNAVITSLVDKTGERLSQAGDLKATARSTAPSGWLLCAGQAISRTTYDVLFSAIGTTYGVGDGSATFNVPDLRGRVVVGADNMGGAQANVLTPTFTPNRDVLGGSVGEEAHTLTYEELPAFFYPNDFTGANENSASPYYAVKTVKGGALPHNNVQPGMIVNWLIKI